MLVFNFIDNLIGRILIIYAFYPSRLDNFVFFSLIIIISIVVIYLRFKIKNNLVYFIVFVAYLSITGMNKVSPIINFLFFNFIFISLWLIIKYDLLKD